MAKEEKRKLLRGILREQTVEQLVRQGFTRKQAEMISDRDDINADEEKEEEKKDSVKEVLKRISIEISVDDV